MGNTLLKSFKFTNLNELKRIVGDHDPNKKLDKGRILLHNLCMQEDINITYITYLLEIKSDSNIRDNDGKTSFHHACARRSLDLEILKVFIEHNADLNRQDLSLKTGLHHCCLNPGIKEELISFLIENKADPNIADNIGNIPLHYASRNNKPILVEKLVVNLECLHMENNNGFTPLYLATLNDDRKCYELMKSYENRINKNGDSKRIEEVEEVEEIEGIEEIESNTEEIKQIMNKKPKKLSIVKREPSFNEPFIRPKVSQTVSNMNSEYNKIPKEWRTMLKQSNISFDEFEKQDVMNVIKFFTAHVEGQDLPLGKEKFDTEEEIAQKEVFVLERRSVSTMLKKGLSFNEETFKKYMDRASQRGSRRREEVLDNLRKPIDFRSLVPNGNDIKLKNLPKSNGYYKDKEREELLATRTPRLERIRLSYRSPTLDFRQQLSPPIVKRTETSEYEVEVTEDDQIIEDEIFEEVVEEIIEEITAEDEIIEENENNKIIENNSTEKKSQVVEEDTFIQEIEKELSSINELLFLDDNDNNNHDVNKEEPVKRRTKTISRRSSHTPNPSESQLLPSTPVLDNLNKSESKIGSANSETLIKKTEPKSMLSQTVHNNNPQKPRTTKSSSTDPKKPLLVRSPEPSQHIKSSKNTPTKRNAKNLLKKSNTEQIMNKNTVNNNVPVPKQLLTSPLNSGPPCMQCKHPLTKMGAKFCGKCGSKQVPVDSLGPNPCMKCKMSLRRSGARYCISCGTKQIILLTQKTQSLQ
eukprot:TRINITY_DN2341_c0_g1_i1.p1 TRINITY_DN2341_c0_g1~~TRINITY_DN2341_c0_g1_i1.p1  ORF type:complete len:754 (+),score=217.85 TRINITY_DN2341_c0_g1_i1:37-2298(+)